MSSLSFASLRKNWLFIVRLLTTVFIFGIGGLGLYLWKDSHALEHLKGTLQAVPSQPSDDSPDKAPPNRLPVIVPHPVTKEYALPPFLAGLPLSTLYLAAMIIVPASILGVAVCICGVVVLNYNSSGNAEKADKGRTAKDIEEEAESGNRPKKGEGLETTKKSSKGRSGKSSKNRSSEGEKTDEPGLAELLLMAGAVLSALVLLVSGGIAVKYSRAVILKTTPTLFIPGALINDRYILRSSVGKGGFGEVWLAIDTTRDASKEDVRVAIKRSLPPEAKKKGTAEDKTPELDNDVLGKKAEEEKKEREKKRKEMEAKKNRQQPDKNKTKDNKTKTTTQQHTATTQAGDVKAGKKEKAEEKRLEAEANILKDMDHPNILRFVEYIPSEDILVTEFVDHTLSERRRWLRAEENLQNVVRQIFSALYYLHSVKRKMHMDLKPQNILINRSHRVKLIDFGLMRTCTRKGRGRRGTTDYLAPEVVSESTQYDEKADIWSAGMTIIGIFGHTFDIRAERLRVLASRKLKPGRGVDKLAIYNMISRGDEPNYHYLNEFSPGCTAFVRRCLTFDPAKRPSAKELLEDPWLKL